MKLAKLILLNLLFTICLNPAFGGTDDCRAALVSKSGGGYKFSQTAVIASLDSSTPSARDQSLANALGYLLIQKKRLPTLSEFIAFGDWENALRLAGLFVNEAWDYDQLRKFLIRAHKLNPGFYQPFHTLICQQAFLFFRHRLRPPSSHELAVILGFEDERLLDMITHLPKFWDGVIESDVGRHIDYARKRINAAFARAVRGTDTPAAYRTRRIPPTVRRVAQILSITRSNEHFQWRIINGDYKRFELVDPNTGNFNLEVAEAMLEQLTNELEAMLGLRKLETQTEPSQRWVFDMPVLFPGGMDQLYESTRSEFQPSFTSYENVSRFPVQKAKDIRDKITQAPGLVISGFKPGRPIDWAQLAGMKQLARDRGFVLVLIPEDGMWQDIDSRLIEDPEVHILTHSLANKELLISVFPSNDRGDPLTPFKKPGMYEIGQQIIFPHPALVHEAIPTAKNDLNQTQLYTTGTINKPLVAAVGKFQKAKAIRTAKEMKQAFLVVEKIDKGSDTSFGGVGSRWHIRPIEVKPSRQSRGTQEPTLFVDNGSAYRISPEGNVSVGKSPITTLYLSDAHMISADPKILMALEEYLTMVSSPDTKIQIVIPDPIDNFWLNGHIQKKQKNQRIMRDMVRSGKIFGEKEINDFIGNINALMKRFPNISVICQHSNHTFWIDRHLLNEPTELQSIANGDLRDEIMVALHFNPQWSPFEYLMIHRERFLKGVSLDGSDRWQQGKVFISNPSRVRVMGPGEPLSTTSEFEGLEFALQHHGDKGANGGHSSFQSHQVGEKRIITGDAHRMGYYGRGENFWIGVGSLYPFQAYYTKEGYSSWGVGLASVFADGTATLVQYDPNSESFLQRTSVGVLNEESFFGDDPLRVVTTMDDDQERIAVDEREWQNWLRNKTRWINTR